MVFEHARPIFTGRLTEPAMGGPKERTLVSVPQNKGDLREGNARIGQMMLRQLAARIFNELRERRSFCHEPTLEGVVTHVQLRGDRRAQRAAILQMPRNGFAGAMRRIRCLQPAQRLNSKPVMQFRQLGNGGRQFAGEILVGDEKAAEPCIELQRRAKRLVLGRG